MKGLLMCLILSCSLGQAMAEYNGSFIELNIHRVDGTSAHGHVFIIYWHPEDSLAHSDYLLQQIELVSSNYSLHFHSHLLSYSRDYGDSNDQTNDYVFSSEFAIARSEIKSLEYINCIRWTYLFGVQSIHQAEDSVWMKTKPLETIGFSNSMADKTIFVHDDSPDAKIALDEIKLYLQQEVELDEYGDIPQAYLNRLEELLLGLNTFKVVITYDG